MDKKTKNIRDCTFEEFSEWCERRACDGAWSMETAIVCIKAIDEVMSIRPLFGRKKAREKRWKEVAEIYFKPDGKIEI